MEGRRSTDRSYVFGYPKELSKTKLPTESDIVSHSQFLKREHIASKVWKTNTPLSQISIKVAGDVCALWSQTGIPHLGTNSRDWVNKRVEKLLLRAKDILKVPSDRRDHFSLSNEWGGLFDISLCPHKVKKKCDCPHCTVAHPPLCNCLPGTVVPEPWLSFLWDQREMRVECLLTIKRDMMRARGTGWTRRCRTGQDRICF